MKVSVDGKEIFELTEIQKKTIKNDIHEDEFEEDMHRRLSWILSNKFENCFERLKKEWELKLSSRYDSLPTNKDEILNLIFSQSDYMSKKERHIEYLKGKSN